MGSKRGRPITTIKVSRRIMRHIEANSEDEAESADSVLRRLFGLKNNGVRRVRRGFSTMKTIKVSRLVMDHIIKKSRPRESRDQTVGRLLGVQGDDGNVRTKP